MRSIKKILALILAAATVISLAACGGQSSSPSEYDNKYSGVGEIINTGVIKAVCPKNWNNTPAYDLAKSDTEAVDNELVFVKGGTSISEDKTYIKISYYPSGEEVPSPDSSGYLDVQPVQNITAGDRIWEGFTAAVSGQYFCYAAASDDKGTYVVYLWLHVGEEGQTFIEDSEVNVILASLEAV